jgi:hypothetical protein
MLFLMPVIMGCAVGRSAVVDNAGYGEAKGTERELEAILERSESRIDAGLRDAGEIADTIRRLDAELQLYFDEVEDLRKRLEKQG